MGTKVSSKSASFSCSSRRAAKDPMSDESIGVCADMIVSIRLLGPVESELIMKGGSNEESTYENLICFLVCQSRVASQTTGRRQWWQL